MRRAGSHNALRALRRRPSLPCGPNAHPLPHERRRSVTQSVATPRTSAPSVLRSSDLRPPPRRSRGAWYRPASCGAHRCAPPPWQRPDPLRSALGIMARSNSAKAPTICIIIRPAGVVVSMCSVSERKPAPASPIFSMMCSRSFSERDNRSSFPTTTTSPGRRWSSRRCSSGRSHGRRRPSPRTGGRIQRPGARHAAAPGPGPPGRHGRNPERRRRPASQAWPRRIS